MKLYPLVLALLFSSAPATVHSQIRVSVVGASATSKGASALFAGPRIGCDAQVTTGPEAASKQFLLLLLGESVVGAVFFFRRRFLVQVAPDNREKDND